MVLKLTAKINFCGKLRKFKRCPNNTLVDYQKKIDEVQDKTIPLAERTRDYQFEITELQDEVDSIEESIILLKSLEDASDDEIREAMDLVKQKTSIQKKIHQLRREFDNTELENRAFYTDLEKELRDAYAEFASVIFNEFDVAEIEDADSTDLTIAPHLHELYRLATSGASQKEVDKAYKKIVGNSFRL